MKIFSDYYNNTVKLAFEEHPFSEKPKHVLVVTRIKGKWLLTKHKTRGMEFPGGKVESGETAEAAAIREVKEETGGTVRTLTYVGQYYVDGKADQIVKNLYLADVDDLEEQETYYETDGPVIMSELPKALQTDERFSFIMKDDVVTSALTYIRTNKL
ncbi:putative 8-oxo-dGTP diphosphatase YtkD [Halolactibacillus alkaliphilus]|uniref:Putative 8-oxo-dGTP diphosphatase YtkD n=1 Tax=Halolactibacillus alkaliphilus TaxID=442899 RepID=A0A511X3Z6_9BACI|nr:nucleoside triphosphatase YtkD [Halolactibacillus alkaliphilus]GEN57669.1 putative 8-oxo-dGTP diphosphatase YtkD [Halolactibacillus alkaliphilus]GGN74603.1 putative 8-oxo-dGTP diphosphatase YtkD [Halolactibacillus alkaliphilus]SFP02744.1 8-oxo-dGTPase [Halolactibacillus alkaliphilus]